MSSNSNLIYDVPANLAGAYGGKTVKLRTADPCTLLALLDEKDFDSLVSIQVNDLDCDLTTLHQCNSSVPLELMVSDPVADFPLLYGFSALVEFFPIRACISLRPGFSKAVRVAAALHFSIKLEVGQPDTAIIPELIDTLDFYLHSSGVTEPIEFFHSFLIASCHGQAINLWSVQEEDPLLFRYVDNEGRESFPGRLAGCDTLANNPADHQDCRNCLYLARCWGFFKWPDHDYDCGGIKDVFARIEAAAIQLRYDITEEETTRA